METRAAVTHPHPGKAESDRRQPATRTGTGNGSRTALALVLALAWAGAGASALHRVRHDHLRREPAGSPFPRCDAPAREAAAAAAAAEAEAVGRCSRPRQRRAAPWGLELGQTVGKTLCPFAVCEDRDENRRPRSVHKVVCLEAGCRCTDEGAYRCVQVVDEVEVLYRDDRSADAWTPKRVKMEVGCVCAADVARRADAAYPNALDQ